MKASELIKELQELIDEHGDLPVCLYEPDELCMNMEFNEVEGVHIDKQSDEIFFVES